MDNSFTTLNAMDLDDTDVDNIFFHFVENGFALNEECGEVFCLVPRGGQLYFNKSLVSSVSPSYIMSNELMFIIIGS